MKPMSVLEALGEGIASVPETLWDGIKRTGQSVEFWNEQEQDKIGAQDIRAYGAIKKIIDYGVSTYNSPIERAIRIILYYYYESLPESEREKIKATAVRKGVYISAKVATSMILSGFVARELTKKIVANAGVKFFFKTLIKSELTIIAIQGLLYKAGAASDRLRAKFPRIWSELSRHDLDMIYFIIEKPMQKYLEAIRLNRMRLYTKLRG